MSDVYSFGVVLLELLTGRKSVDKSRPAREQKLVEWARPMLRDPRKVGRILDPRLEGQYSEAGARKAAELAYQCLRHRPKQRPAMRTVVEALEPLQDFSDLPVGTFVFTFPPEDDPSQKREARKSDKPKEEKRDRGHHHQHHNQRHRRRLSPKSVIHSDTALGDRSHRHGLRSPLHQKGWAEDDWLSEGTV